jgi:hypothetical protein
MKFSLSQSVARFSLALGLLAAMALPALAQKANQTLGYGNGKVLTFTYKQNFDCIDQPGSDLNFNGIPAESDPGEMQIPICQVGTQPAINPPGQNGNPLATTEPIYVLVPMFSADNDQNPNDAISCTNVVPGTICGSTLGSTLISIFGALPEAFKASPEVYTQCPEPGSAPGTCTMHASRLDLGPALVSLGLVKGPVQNIFVPTPNHSHVLIAQDVNLPAIWWQVIPILVLHQSDWPAKDGSGGLTSFAAIEQAVKAGNAIEAPSNFFLFFSSYVRDGATADHAHMHMN